MDQLTHPHHHDTTSTRVRRRVAPALTALAAVGAAALIAAPAGSAAGARTAATPTVSVRSTKLGRILVDSKGITLYLWVKDKHRTSVCTGAC